MYMCVCVFMHSFFFQGATHMNRQLAVRQAARMIMACCSNLGTSASSMMLGGLSARCLPCWQKMHEAYHAGCKCMRPTVLAVYARGAEMHLAGISRALRVIFLSFL